MPVAIAFSLVDEVEQGGTIFSQAANPVPWITQASKNWMAEIPDNIPLNKLSIPGTHDTGALYGGRICETQGWTIKEQLDTGIRFFDIRCRRAGNVFAIHHGFCFQNIYFGGVMEDVANFLAKSPGETILMRVKEEHFPISGSDSFQKIWNRYLGKYGSLFMPDLGNRIPQLGEVRGKVVVLRNAAFEGFGIPYEGTVTDIQDYFRVYRSKTNYPRGPDSVSLRQKKKFVREYLTRAQGSSKIVLNFASGSTGLFPDTVARKTNVFVYDMIGRVTEPKTTGVVIMDFPGEKLVYRILKTNFV